MIPESDKNFHGPQAQGLVMSTEASRGEIEQKVWRGLRPKSIRNWLALSCQGMGMAPGQIMTFSYLLGRRNFGLNHTDVARQD